MLRKKILGVLFVVTLLLTACGNNARNETSTNSDKSSNQEVTTNYGNAEMKEETTKQAKEETTKQAKEELTEGTTNKAESTTDTETTKAVTKIEVETETIDETTGAETTDPTLETDGLDSDTEKVTGDDTMFPIIIQIGDKSFTANLYKNSTTDKFVEQLPLTVDMSELNGNEKYYYLSASLPTNTESIGSIRTGDIMLYGSDCLVLFYEDFETSYSYTRMGYLEDATELAETLGQGNVQVSFMIGE